MKMSFRSTVYSLSTALLLLGCDSGQKNDQLLQAKVDAERVKDLQTQNQELKNEKTELEKENGALKTELTAIKAQLAEAQRANRVATRPAPEKKGQQRSSEKQSTSRPTKKDIEAVREQATGGGSFK